MKRWLLLLLAGLIGSVGALPGRAGSDADPASLRCEYLVNPLGIDSRVPRLSWNVDGASGRGVRQSAYQVLVASNEKLLRQDKGDLWDSGKIEGDRQNQVEYAGKALESRMRCYWKVRVWLGDGKPTGWSQPAFWEMGLLKSEDWSALWIEKQEKRIATPPASLKVLKALYGADGAEVDVTEKVAGMIKDRCLVVRAAGLAKDPAPKKKKRLVVECEIDGKRITKQVEEGDYLSIPDGLAPDGRLSYMRKTFQTAKPVDRARLYATAFGLYEIHLNGQRVGDQVFAPEWTCFWKRLRYQAYDVTALVKRGDNVIAAVTANGWYARAQRYDVSALFAQLEVTYGDGSVERIVSDESWKCHFSPILSSDFLMGENYDARLAVPGWDGPGLDDSQWVAAKVRKEGARPLDAQVMEPTRKICELRPKTLSEPKPGSWVFDFGQNMVGFLRLKLKAKAGTQVVIRHAEMLNPDGTVYTTNLRSAKSIDTYTCKGSGTETWEPHFTFHGFRYAEVTGLAGKPSMDLVTGVVVASDTPRVGEFACSDPRVNQLYSNIIWGQRGNYLSVPTDCPQRDERLGWMGDAQVFVKTATLNNDVAAFYTKWLVDVDDCQKPDGVFADVSPGGGNGTPAWGDAGVICPWTIYLAYGDKRLLEQHLPAMTKWIEWCREHSSGLLREKDRGGDYGDWLSIKANTPKDVIGTAYFAYSTRIVAQAYKALGKHEEAAKYEQLFQEIKAAFTKAYVAADGRIKGDTQCCYVMALKFDLLSDEMRAKAAQYLEDDIRAKDLHLSTGFVGVSYLLPVLTETGKNETACKLLLQDSFPSWLFSVKHGATTIWERWDGWTPEKGFQDPGMNSFNHYSYGSCGEWLFNSLAGIAFDPAMPGYKQIICKPHPGEGITWVKASYNSIQGLIASRWKKESGKFVWELRIPSNTTATVYLPAKDASTVTEGGKPAAKAKGLNFLRMENGAAVYEAGSGSYRFVSAY